MARNYNPNGIPFILAGGLGGDGGFHSTIVRPLPIKITDYS